MDIQGSNIIGQERSALGRETYRAFYPREGKAAEPSFHQADQQDIERAMALAEAAAVPLRSFSSERVADFLLTIKDEIVALGDALIERASQESGLDTGRLTGERDRTTNQLKMFADLVREGSWVDARIDTAIPDRKPLPRADIRRMLRPIGPVVVFGASNFPLAFSVAGGDSAAALAAKNPVVVKAHPAHPGTSELVGVAIQKAVKSCHFPEGTFSLLHGLSPEMSISLVTHAKTRAVAFTGSGRAGRAMFDAAAKRPEPIPVFAEMGSVNPLFVLPEALEERATAIADGLYKSVLLGVGQFCTCPGLVFGIESPGFTAFVNKLEELFEHAAPGTMLNPSISKHYEERFQNAAAIAGVEVHRPAREAEASRTEGRPGLLIGDATTWLKNETLHEEIFGPATVVVRCSSAEQLLECSGHLAGTLTATLHGAASELKKHPELVDVLSRKAGRLIFNGFPTGVEVGHAMHHGGPYPATCDEKFTSVGTASVYRFARPVCYQAFPQELLPPELQDANPRGIFRLVNGQMTREAL